MQGHALRQTGHNPSSFTLLPFLPAAATRLRSPLSDLRLSRSLLLRRRADLIRAAGEVSVIHRIRAREDPFLRDAKRREVALVQGSTDERGVELADDLALDPFRSVANVKR